MPEELAQHKLLVEIAAGLRAKPAYLLIFGVCTLFLLSGLGNSIVGALKENQWLLGFGFASFLAALLAALLTVRLIEKDNYVAPSYGDLHVNHSTVGDIETDAGFVSDHLEASRILDSFPSQLDSRFTEARDIVLFGVHQSHILIRYYDLIQTKLGRGDCFRVLLMDPAGHAVNMTTQRFPGVRRNNQEVERIQSSLESFCELKKIAPERLELKIYDFLFAYGGFLFDAEAENGACYIQLYTFRVHGGPRKPKYVLTRIHQQDWFQLYRQEIEGLWNAATPVDCQPA